MKQTSSDKRGWGWEHSPLPLSANLRATARAVMALAKINEMLDVRINHIILKHFSVKKKNRGLDASLTLDSLFYPDYGLRRAKVKVVCLTRPEWIKEKDWPESGIQRENSVAITLQRMRTHVSGVSLPKGDPLYSLVLHGPAGTGKTTLVEALAVSCDVPLVEVTPSDLVKYGEEDIEQRARAVFEALSMLTRAVILFDEFDPVLKRREADSNKSLNVFSFLTPGMLPKLKDLNNGAKKRAVAYVLVTNLIGKLDEAAVRKGRFDEQMGIYPPDLLSRTGRFLDQILQSNFTIDNEKEKEKVAEVIRRTEGKGMTALGQPGWFTRTDDPKEKTPFRYILEDRENFDDPEPDDKLKGIQGEGRAATLEWLQWTWISEWDNKLSATYDGLRDCLNEDIQIQLPPGRPAQGSRDQWEVTVARDKTLACQLLIRRLDHDMDET